MIFATTKTRILKFIEYKGVTLPQFFKKTGIKRGFLDSDKLSASVSDIYLTMIIASYPELNIYWLLTGNGEMLLRDTKPIGRAKSDPTTIYIDNTDKDATIQLQREHIELLKEKIVRLTEDVVFTGVRSTTKDSDVVLDEPWPPVNNPPKKRESP